MAERAAGNAPLQGTTADIIKLAMLHVDQAIKESDLKDQVCMIMQIHDELVFEVADEVIPHAEKLIKQTMENVLTKVFSEQVPSFRGGPHEVGGGVVPIDVSISHGKTWGEAKD
jgi:DNA polymerase-1